MNDTARRPWIGPAVAGGLVFLLHAALAAWVPSSRFLKYPLAAKQLLAGELPTERLTDFSPLYLELNVWAARVSGAPELVILVLQLVLIGLSAGLLYTLLRRTFPAPLAVAGVALFAVDRHLLVYGRVLEPEAVMLALLLLAVLLLERGRGVPGALGAGVVAGLSIVTRPTFLPIFLLVPIFFAWRDGITPKAPWLRRSAVFLVPVLLAGSLLALRAQRATGDAGTPAMNPGTVFFEGNNPLSRGTSAVYPPVVLHYTRHAGTVPDAAHTFYRTVARGAAGDPDLEVTQVNGFWSRHATAFLLDHPGHALGLALDKLLHAFHSFRWHDIPNGWTYESRLPFPAPPFAVLSSLALLGLLFEARRWRRSLLFYVLAASQIGVMLVFYVSARQRMVLLPALIYFAAAALTSIWNLDRRRRILWLGLAVALALALALPNHAMRDETYLQRSYAEAQTRLDQVREASKTQPLARHPELAVVALASGPRWFDWMRPPYFPEGPGHGGPLEGQVADGILARMETLPAHMLPSARFDRAWLLLRAGRTDEAAEILESLVESGERFYRGSLQPSEPLLLLARARHRSGRTDDAVDLLRRALDVSPGNPFVLADLVALTGDAEARELLFTYWSEPDAHFALGRAALFYDRPGVALGELGPLVAMLPEFREARVLLAAALAGVDRVEEGAREMLAANSIREEPILEAERVCDLFRRWAELHLDNPEVQLLAARGLHQHGRFEDALVLLDGMGVAPAGLADRAERLRRQLTAH
ncbi:MAG: tetratricopeptide repeat protein [Acidobacteriota bacterium]